MRYFLSFVILFFSFHPANAQSGQRIKKLASQINDMAQSFSRYEDLSSEERTEIRRTMKDLKTLMRSYGMEPDSGGATTSIEVLWQGPGKTIQAINSDGKKILPSNWKATDFKVSDTIIALTLNENFYSRDSLGNPLTPDDWKADWYIVNNHFVVLTRNDNIYAYTNEGKSVIKRGWKGKNIKFSGPDGDRIKFEWGNKVHLIDKDGNDLAN